MELYMAPIKDITTAFYRNHFMEIFGGYDACYAPFIATTHMRKQSSPLFKDILPENNTAASNLVPQILSNQADDFRFFATTIADMGYKEINWNIGCPSPAIVRKTKGSGLLPYPHRIRKFLEDVCMDSHYKLSVKMRIGLNNLEEGIQVIDVLNDFPLSSVIIHGRTGEMLYKGHSDIDAFKTLGRNSKHPLTYNGDIFSLDSFKNIQSQLPTINHFMIGRGALRDPFLPNTIKGITCTDEEKLIKIKAFHDLLYAHFKDAYTDEYYLCSKMKQFWQDMSPSVDPTGVFYKDVLKCATIKAYEVVTDSFFSRSL